MSANIINVPDRALSWRWLDESDEKRLSFIHDSKKPNAGTFVLSKEDHTLGNLIRLQLLRDSSVRFAGYRMPHPLIFDCHVRVETMDSKLTPTNVFDAALSDLQLETETLSRKWDVSYFFHYLKSGIGWRSSYHFAWITASFNLFLSIDCG